MSELSQALKDCGALQFGEFTLASGAKSDYYIDIKKASTNPKVLRLIARLMAQKMRDEGIQADRIAGVVLGSVPLATALSLETGIPYVMIRKEKKDHGDGGMMVGTQLADGMKVLLVDDVMTAGTAVREVVPKLKAEADVEIVGLVLSVDRMEKTKDSDLSAVKAVEAEFGFPVMAIANVREIFEAGRSIMTADGTPYVTDEIAAAADAYLAQYGA